MANTLFSNVCNARALGAQKFVPAVYELSATSHAPVRLNCQAFLKRSLPSKILQVACARKCRQRTKGGIWRFGGRTVQGCKLSSSFVGILPENFLCISNRILQRRKEIQSLPNTQTVVEAKDSSGNEGFSVTRGVFENDDSVIEDRFNRFSNAMESGDDKLTEQILEEMGYSVDINEMKGLVKEVVDMQAQLQELHDEVEKLVEEGDEETASVLIEANLKAVMEQLEAGHHGMEQIAMLDELAQLRMSLGEFEEAEILLEQIKVLVASIGMDVEQPLADKVLEHMGSMYNALGKPAEGVLYYLKSIQIQEDLVGEDSPLLVNTLLGLATAHTDMDDSESAIKVYNRVLSLMEKIKGPMDETLALPLSKLGQCLLEEARVDEAEEVLQRALTLLEQSFGANDGRVGIAKCALARVYATGGDVDEAISMYEDGMQIMAGDSSLGDDDSSLETARTDLAELLNLVGRIDESEKLWEENLRVKEEFFGPNHPSLIVHLQNLATAYAVAEKHEQCVPLLRRSLKLAVEDMGPDAPQVSVPLVCLATALHHLNRQQEAELIARRALEIREAHYDPDSGIVGEGCNCLASILHANGKYGEALTLMKRVLAIQEKELGPDDPVLVLTLELIIMLLDKSGRADEIEPYYLRLAILSVKDGEGECDEAGSFDSENIGDLRNLGTFDSRPVPVSNIFDIDDSDVIDI
ncbi:hypothetical protein KC19_2G090400 [Ceratodon purpureus]|uniref:Kinesin light chain n=1 Tax=Ceratodon purpureus TaxID=3225 RepID=A0A8T0ITH3_CERPU|nr:hypothetical protein KC19_2G090400 [Ceratodon purpureus]